MMKRIVISGIGFVILVIAGGIFMYQKNNKPFLVEAGTFTKIENIEDEGSLEKISTIETKKVAPEEDLKTQEETQSTKIEESQKEEVVEISTKGIVQKLVSFGYEEAGSRKIDTIVLHSSHAVSGDPYDVNAVIALWKSYGVAPHYMVARDGTIYRLVADKNIAYHAGDSKMPDGRNGVNNFSIGVEILNTKTDDYTSAQYSAVRKLIDILEGKYGKMKVVGHDTIAPGRKTDPWNFDWDKI